MGTVYSELIESGATLEQIVYACSMLGCGLSLYECNRKTILRMLAPKKVDPDLQAEIDKRRGELMVLRAMTLEQAAEQLDKARRDWETLKSQHSGPDPDKVHAFNAMHQKVLDWEPPPELATLRINVLRRIEESAPRAYNWGVSKIDTMTPEEFRASEIAEGERLLANSEQRLQQETADVNEHNAVAAAMLATLPVPEHVNPKR